MTSPQSEQLASLQGRLIVSCQAPEGDPMRETGTLVRLAQSAVAGGAAGLRVNDPEVVTAVRDAVDLPIVGLWKDGDEGVRITPTVRHATAIAEAGAHLVATDATARPRPDGSTFADTVEAVHAAGALVMADVSTLEEGLAAVRDGADLVSSTLSGYTPHSAQQEGPDLVLVAELAERLQAPVVAEGRIRTPQEAAAALAAGAHSVVVGTAITAPTALTRQFATHLGQR